MILEFRKKIAIFATKSTKMREPIRITKHYIYFWGSCFSNWAEAPFKAVIDGKKLDFSNSEQYFMYIKAKTFGDEATALKILMDGADPKAAKTFGRMVKNYNDAVWNEKRYQVMVDACLLKFEQNADMKALLLSDELKGRHFVEGSPIDKIWGIGCHWKEAKDDQSNWNGLNLLGKCLDEVRERLSKK